jgi:hypothetical protein
LCRNGRHHEQTIDWTKCDSATQDLSVEEMIRLIESAPPDPWPSGWAAWPNVNEALRVMARRFADSLTPGRHAYAEGRGIVIAGGGLKYFPSVWVGVHLVRHFGCTLPIQLWHLGKGEIERAGYALRSINYEGEVVPVEADTILAQSQEHWTLWAQR